MYDIPATQAKPTRNANAERAKQKGILDVRDLPDEDFNRQWESIFLPTGLKDRLLAQAVLNFTARTKLREQALPIHGVILLVGPPGTGKTTLARGLASRTAKSLNTGMKFIEVEPHGLAGAALGKSQQAVSQLLGTTIPELAQDGPCVVLLDEVESLAADRQKMSLEANPVDVHRATDAVLAQLDQLGRNYPNLLFVSTSNFAGAIDQAFTSRADLIATVDRPDEAACKEILKDTLDRIAAAFPAVAKIKTAPAIERAAESSVGLDGRRIRKAVVSALAHTKEIALKPESLTAAAVLAEIQRAKKELDKSGGTQ